MKKLMLILAGLALTAAVSNPQEAAAEDKLGKCTIQAVDSCDKEFGSEDYYLVAIRGWCYMIRTAQCMSEGDD